MGPIDLPDPAKDNWQLTLHAKKKIYGETMMRPSGPDPVNPRAADPAAECDTPAKARRTNETIEPITFHDTPEATWEEILSVVGANNPIPKMVCELVACDATLGFLCLKKGVPYLGVCFNDFHRGLLRKRLAQLVFASMLEDQSPFSTPESCLELQKLWRGKDAPKEDNNDEDAASSKVNSKVKSKTPMTTPKKHNDNASAKQSPQGGVSIKRKRRQSKGPGRGDDSADQDPNEESPAAGPAAKRAALLEKLNSALNVEDDKEGQEIMSGDEDDEGHDRVCESSGAAFS